MISAEWSQCRVFRSDRFAISRDVRLHVYRRELVHVAEDVDAKETDVRADTSDTGKLSLRDLVDRFNPFRTEYLRHFLRRIRSQ